MKKLLKYFLSIISSILLFTSCCNEDCPCNSDQISEFSCAPREATITQFNAKLEENPVIITNPEIEIFYEPVPEYSIHTFEFPGSPNSSGNLPNDERFSSDRGIDSIAIVKVSVENYGIDGNYYYALLNDKPANFQISGDLLVDSIFIEVGEEPYALVRFRGEMTGISERINIDPNAPPQFMSESSRDMCDYIQSNINSGSIEIVPLRESLSQYGQDALRGNGTPLANIINYEITPPELPAVINSLGQIVVNSDMEYNRDLVLPDTKLESDLEKIKAQIDANMDDARDDFNEYLLENEMAYVNVELRIGDVFLYRAVNGRDFIVTVINIDERDQGVALKKRLSIMFNEI